MNPQSSSDYQIERISKLFAAFASHNDVAPKWPAVGHDYSFVRVEDSGSPLASIERHLQPNENYEIRLHASDPTGKEVSKEFASWLFINLADWPFGRDGIASHLWGVVCSTVGCPDDIWRVELTASDGEFLRPWYDAAWSDFLLRVGRDLYLIHLGVSD